MNLDNNKKIFTEMIRTNNYDYFINNPEKLWCVLCGNVDYKNGRAILYHEYAEGRYRYGASTTKYSFLDFYRSIELILEKGVIYNIEIRDMVIFKNRKIESIMAEEYGVINMKLKYITCTDTHVVFEMVNTDVDSKNKFYIIPTPYIRKIDGKDALTKFYSKKLKVEKKKLQFICDIEKKPNNGYKILFYSLWNNVCYGVCKTSLTYETEFIFSLDASKIGF